MCKLKGYALTSSRHGGELNSTDRLVTKSMVSCGSVVCSLDANFSMLSVCELERNGLDQYQLADIHVQVWVLHSNTKRTDLSSRITSFTESGKSQFIQFIPCIYMF